MMKSPEIQSAQRLIHKLLSMSQKDKRFDIENLTKTYKHSIIHAMQNTPINASLMVYVCMILSPGLRNREKIMRAAEYELQTEKN